MSKAPTRTRSDPPPHPGAVLRDDVLPAARLSVAAAARHLGITRQALHKVLAERAGVSPEMALRLGKLCGNGPQFWLDMQQALDLWRAEQAIRSQLGDIPTRTARPVSRILRKANSKG
jgi:addiction module HigA family antidote